VSSSTRSRRFWRKKAAIAAIRTDIATRDAEVKQIGADQQRIRANLQSLKDTSEQRALVKRFSAQLTQQEDRIEVLRREMADLMARQQQANAELLQLLGALAIELRVQEPPSS
jgi:chromosome segregation ATPase